MNMKEKSWMYLFLSKILDLVLTYVYKSFSATKQLSLLWFTTIDFRIDSKLLIQDRQIIEMNPPE